MIQDKLREFAYMLRGIAEIVTTQPDEDLKKNCREKVLGQADVQKEVFTFAEKYRQILVDFVDKWEQKKYDNINNKDKILKEVEKLIKELEGHKVITGIFDQILGTTHKGEGEEFKMLEFYYNKSKAYEDANKKKTFNEN